MCYLMFAQLCLIKLFKQKDLKEEQFNISQDASLLAASLFIYLFIYF